ncbi:MAG: TRAP transporter small permease subunit [Rhodobacterales bacterium]|nr:TRAP transporter small permease subunit [Rhodobacterales bacterium]
MQRLLSIADAIDRLNAAVGRLVSWLVLIMVLVGAFNAIGRYLGPLIGIRLASNGWLELQWYLFSLVFLLGAGDALRRDAHVRVDVLYGQLSVRRKAALNLAGTLLFLLPFCVFAVWMTYPSVLASWQVLEGSPDAGGLPRYPIKSAILACFVLLGLQGIAQAIRHTQTLTQTQ